MWDTILHYIQNGPVKLEIIESILMIAGILLLRTILLQAHFRSHPTMPIEEKRRWAVMGRNVTLILVIFGLTIIWAAQIHTLALSMFAVAAAVVLATKELIMCLSGSVLRATTKQYSVGDYIEVNGLRGRVVDINLFNTLMMQIGPNTQVGQLSGKAVSFPNSLLLSHSVQRDNVMGSYIIHTFDIPVPIHLDSDQIVPPLQQLLEKRCAPFVPAIEKHLEAVQTQKLFITPAAQPRITRVPHDDKVYNIVVRFASPLQLRLDIQQTVLDEYIRIQYRLLNPSA
ncbi:mechanosensitive ion channel family protein [Neisseria zalophi]|uniref:Mechanosensitive ion channel family protein n=1 Tax=Neisseria zalophi TaxID=640030 RepID=A0A5J6PW04_9NEIS|nr:mechanosensitive ion channel family protein [Neisseria zalophi]QEY25243.1 mechanosensitive ion channel family protein [Neisseria zalophi]